MSSLSSSSSNTFFFHFVTVLQVLILITTCNLATGFSNHCKHNINGWCQRTSKRQRQQQEHAPFQQNGQLIATTSRRMKMTKLYYRNNNLHDDMMTWITSATVSIADCTGISGEDIVSATATATTTTTTTTTTTATAMTTNTIAIEPFASPWVITGLALALGVVAQTFINSMLEGDQGLSAFLRDGSGYNKSGFRPRRAFDEMEDKKEKTSDDNVPLPWLKLPQLDFVEVPEQEQQRQEALLMEKMEYIRQEMNVELERGNVEEATKLRTQLERMLEDSGMEYRTD